jgi:hypothetical protein
MRKKIVQPAHAKSISQTEREWLDLEDIATVEVTSEDPQFPIEQALRSAEATGWRAAEKGDQQIRVVFDEPIAIHRTQLRFDDTEIERTHEFALRWLQSTDGPALEILRQQWNFSPSGSTTELEDYKLNLTSVSALELTIRPDISGKPALATLSSWRIA